MKISFQKISKFQFSSQFFFLELEGKGHKLSQAKLKILQLDYGSSQLGLDSSLICTPCGGLGPATKNHKRIPKKLLNPLCVAGAKRNSKR